jgi:dihydrolipoamide dehydrogenase
VPTYDIAVLGGGPGGYVAALRAAKRGAKVCCIEARAIGGVCMNVGCIPTKAMLHASEIFTHIGRAQEYGLVAGKPAVDGAAFMKRVTGVVGALVQSLDKLMKARQVDVIRGRGRLTAPDTLVVDCQGGPVEIKAKSIILATGSRPARPAFLPWDSGRVWTTDDATTVDRLPESVIIVGGGVIGSEFATVYAELGIPTTVIEMLDRVAANIDEEGSKAITRSLTKCGVKVRTKSRVVGMKAGGAGVIAELEGGETIEAAYALAAVGRLPNVENIGLEAVGVRLDGKVIAADDRCRTNIDGIYAVGDAASTLQYAHLASRMGIVAADNATGHAASDPRTVVPQVVYSHPEVAMVGISEAEAAKFGKPVRVAKFFYLGSGMARAYGDTDGIVKIVAGAELGNILGAVVIGQHASDVIQEIGLAMRNELTVEEIASTMHPHPTFVEGVMEAAEAWLGLPVHG